MKTLAKLTLCTALIAMLTGCTTQTMQTTYTEEEKELIPSMFVEVEDSGYWWVVYHKDTKVMYTISHGNSCGTFTLLVNPDGTPMIWEG